MALASTLLLIIKIKQIIKKRTLAGIALMSIAIITMLNVSAYGLEDLKIEGDDGAGGGGTSCTVTTKCYSGFGTEMVSVSCTGAKCKRDNRSVTCDGETTSC